MSKYSFTKLYKYFESIPDEKYTFDSSSRIEPIQTLYLSNLNLKYKLHNLFKDFGQLETDRKLFGLQSVGSGKECKDWLLLYLSYLNNKRFKNKLEGLIYEKD